MKYLSVCSGIEAATVAWHGMGWKPLAFSEIEKFPAAVLAHHYPETPNLGDMTKFKEWENYAPDILVGGTPCQSFSVAGLRKGLDDPRGNLMLTYLGIADRYRPRWVVWENVPGVLSSNGGKDFGTFLGALGEIGYGFAYRVLDAQYFGVPQRRRRVFVVGHLGDWRRAAAVLFERHSLQWHPAPSREKGEEATANVAIGMYEECDSTMNGTGNERVECEALVYSIMPMNSGKDYKARVVEVAQPLMSGGPVGGNQGGDFVVMAHGQANAEISSEHSPALTCNHEAPIVALPINTQIATRHVAMGEGTGLGIGADGDPAYTLQAGHSHAVACFSAGQSSEAGSIAYQIEQAPTLRSGASGTNMTPTLHSGMQVRRLTPVECERLQGFPDNYTNIPWRNKPEAPDGPRYKALGNSMAVPVMRWIGERINLVDLI